MERIVLLKMYFESYQHILLSTYTAGNRVKMIALFSLWLNSIETFLIKIRSIGS